jgi:hypothetical protein
LSKRLTTIIDYVRDCSRRVAQGEIMDLDGLDKNVVDLCNDIGELPQEQAKEMEKHMSGLIKDLEELANNMRVMARKMDAEEQAEKAKGKKG